MYRSHVERKDRAERAAKAARDAERSEVRGAGQPSGSSEASATGRPVKRRKRVQG